MPLARNAYQAAVRTVGQPAGMGFACAPRAQSVLDGRRRLCDRVAFLRTKEAVIGKINLGSPKDEHPVSVSRAQVLCKPGNTAVVKHVLI
jgi:hypothetical protein